MKYMYLTMKTYIRLDRQMGFKVFLNLGSGGNIASVRCIAFQNFGPKGKVSSLLNSSVFRFGERRLIGDLYEEYYSCLVEPWFAWI